MCRRTTEEITHPPVEPQQSEPIPRICVQESPRLSENHDGHSHTERRQGRRGRTKFFPKGQSPLLSAYKHPVSAHTRPSFDRKHSAHCGNQGDGLALETKSTLSQVLIVTQSLAFRRTTLSASTVNLLLRMRGRV